MLVMSKSVFLVYPTIEELIGGGRDQYVNMKVKEKGIDPKTIRKNDKRNSRDPRPDNSGAYRFNAFKEMAKLQKGERPNLAAIPDHVAIVGTPMPLPHRGGDKGKKRTREDDDEEGQASKTAKLNEVRQTSD